MPLNGAGTFNRLYNFVADRIAGIHILATRMDAEIDGLASAVSTALMRDGQSVVTAPIGFNGQRITNLGAPTADTDALNRTTGDGRYAQLSGGAGAAFTGAISATAVSAVNYAFNGHTGTLISADAGTDDLIIRTGSGTTGTPYKYASIDAAGNLAVQGNVVASGSLNGVGGVYLSGSYPAVRWTAGVAAADWKNWDIYADGNALHFRAVSDAYSAATEYMTAFRKNGWDIDYVVFPKPVTMSAKLTLNQPLEISFAAPYFDLVYGNVLRSRQIIDSSGNWILRNGDSGDNTLYVGTNGAVWTKQLGDLFGAFVKQGGGAYGGSGMTANTVRLGWSGVGLIGQVDAVQLGKIWSDYNCPASLNNYGYQKLASGVILQWGYDSPGISDYYVNFPVTFPNACLYGAGAFDGDPGTTNILAAHVSDVTAASMVVRKRLANNGGTISAAGGGVVRWFAIGY